MYLKLVRKYGLPLQCDLAEIEGHDLMCWCREGSPCHGDALLEMANMGGIEAYFRRRDMETRVCHCHRCGTDWLNEEILPTGACPLCPENTGIHASLSVPVLPRDARVIDEMCLNIEAGRIAGQKEAAMENEDTSEPNDEGLALLKEVGNSAKGLVDALKDAHAPLPPGDLGSRETLPAGGLGADQKIDLPVDDASVVDDLAMLVRRLVHKAGKANGGGALEDQAMDYLKRKGLAGSALRKQNAPHPGGTTDVADGSEKDGHFQCHEFEDWWSDQQNGCPKLVLDNDKDFAAAVWRAARNRHSGRAGVTCAPDCWCLGPEREMLLSEEQGEPSFDPWALLVTPEYIQGRGQFSASDHKGYTNDWKKAGRFRRGEAEEAARRSGGKYVAIPLPVP